MALNSKDPNYNCTEWSGNLSLPHTIIQFKGQAHFSGAGAN